MSGEYVRLYRGLFDDTEFLALSANARLVLLVLKGVLGRIGIGVLYSEQIQGQTGLTDAQIQEGLRVLGKSNKWWVRRSGNVHWIRNGLKHENVNRKNEIQQIVMKDAGLPRCDLVREFREYYADHPALSTVASRTRASTRASTRGATRVESKAKQEQSREGLKDSLSANESPDSSQAAGPDGPPGYAVFAAQRRQLERRRRKEKV